MSNVIHRTTLMQKFSVNTPDYPVTDWIINPDLSALAAVLKKYWKIVGGAVLEMTQAEKDTVDSNALAGQKTSWITAMQAKTTALRDGGYTHLGEPYSLEPDVLTRIVAAAERKDAGRLTFPLKVSNATGTVVTSLVDAAAVEAWIQDAHTRMRELHDDEVGLIEQAVAAVDKAALDTIVDNRA